MIKDLEERIDKAMKRSDTDDFGIKIESLQWVLFVTFAIKHGKMVVTLMIQLGDRFVIILVQKLIVSDECVISSPKFKTTLADTQRINVYYCRHSGFYGRTYYVNTLKISWPVKLVNFRILVVY